MSWWEYWNLHNNQDFYNWYSWQTFSRKSSTHARYISFEWKFCSCHYSALGATLICSLRNEWTRRTRGEGKTKLTDLINFTKGEKRRQTRRREIKILKGQSSAQTKHQNETVRILKVRKSFVMWRKWEFCNRKNIFTFHRHGESGAEWLYLNVQGERNQGHAVLNVLLCQSSSSWNCREERTASVLKWRKFSTEFS